MDASRGVKKHKGNASMSSSFKKMGPFDRMMLIKQLQAEDKKISEEKYQQERREKLSKYPPCPSCGKPMEFSSDCEVCKCDVCTACCSEENFGDKEPSEKYGYDNYSPYAEICVPCIRKMRLCETEPEPTYRLLDRGFFKCCYCKRDMCRECYDLSGIRCVHCDDRMCRKCFNEAEEVKCSKKDD